MWWFLKFLLLFAVLVVQGCGYSLSHRLKSNFKDPRGMFVPVFDNVTDEVGAERVFTNALIREMQSRGEMVISTRDAGGLELHGAITGLTAVPTAYSDGGLGGLASFRRLPTEIGITVELTLALTDLRTGKQMWRSSFRGFRRVEGPLDRTRNFQAPSSLGPLTQSIVESRYTDIARDMMRDVYDEMVELF